MQYYNLHMTCIKLNGLNYIDFNTKRLKRNNNYLTNNNKIV